MKFIVIYSIFASLLYITNSFANNLPEIGNPADRKLSLRQEGIIGQEFYRELLRKNLTINDPETLSYIRHIGNTLANHLENATQPFTFFVVKDSSINAFATPGGFIGVNTGLIAATKNEHELAGVLAHEIAHVHQRHIARRLLDLESSQAVSLATILAGFLAASQGYGQEASALLYGGIARQQQQTINFTREHEIEADRIGINLLTAANYDPTGLVSFFKIIQQQGGGNLESFQHLLTHPLDRIRIAEAENRIAQLNTSALKLQQNSDDYSYIHARIYALNAQDKKQLLQNTPKGINTPRAQYSLAQAYEMNKQWSAAKDIYIRLTETDNKIPFVLGLARSYIHLKAYPKAIKLLKRNLKIQPDHFALNMYYAQALIDNQQAELAIQQLNTFLRKQQPISIEMYQLLSIAYKQTQQIYLAQKTQVEYLYQNGNYNAAIGLLQTMIKDENIEAIEKTLLKARIEQILNTQKAIKELG